ncbi:cell adhesion molecule L1-like a isoform X3 [Salminus brasiliensis]|uniref:cell adhesion molecule L1-like a isoform X3 n=1 Tax=Salminus brasiliensis TaxID=930266 RepID=UPI003B830909
MRGLGGLAVGLLLAFLSAAFGVHIPPQLEQLPTITVHPPTSLIALPFDDSFTLTCEAKGNPKPVFHWTRNGQDFNPYNDSKLIKYESSGTFMIPKNKHLVKYQGKYRCYASNKLGTAVSEEINFIVPTPPKFPKEKIEPVVVNEGESVILECNPPKGIPPVQLYWMTVGLQHIEQDERVSMGLNGNLYFSNTLEKDSRSDYCCFASFSRIRTIVQKTSMAIVVMPLNTSSKADVGLERKPNLLVPSGDQSQLHLVKGEELELECIAEGFPTPVIEWSKLGEQLPKRSNIKNYGKLLTISKVSEEDSGKYMCKIMNDFGEAVHHFHVEVEEPPRWVKEPVKSQVVTIGSDVHIKCPVAGKPQPTINWMRNGKPLLDQSSSHSIVQDDTIILLRALPNDSAVYQCEASNPHGTLLATANVMVMNHPPLILTQDYQEYATVRGKSVVMDCKVFSSPLAAIQWKREDPEGSVEKERFSIHENGSLQIHAAEAEDMGKYMCFATNSEGTSSISAELFIKEPTRIVVPPQDMEVRRGSTAGIECQATFDQSLRGELEVFWQKNGEDMYSNLTDDSGFFIDGGLLQIFNVSHNDKGLYTCIARTPLDEDTATARVTVLDIPDAPVELTLSDHRDRSVRLHWVPTKDHNSPVTEFIIEYEENHWEPGKWRPLLRVSGNQNSAPLSLYGHINYQFRVSAVNGIGIGRPSKASERYKTPPAAPDRNPENIKIEGHLPHQMDITWEPLLPIEHNGPGLEYKLSYRQLGVDDMWTEQMMQRHSLVVKDTPTFVPYEIKIQARNHHGWAPEPRVVTGYSGEDLPLAAPEDVSVEVLNSTLLRVSWSPIPQALLRGHLGGYNVHWWRTQSLLTSKEVPAEKQLLTLVGNRSHAMVPGLKPSSEYRLTVNVFNRRGNGPSSSPLTFRTPQGVPERPPVLKATNSQGDSITLVWAPPLEANGILTGYRLQYQIFNETLDVDEAYTVNISGRDTTQWVVRNLESNSQYKFYLSACTVVGCGPAISEEGGTERFAQPFYEESTSSVPTSINSLLEESTTLFVTATEITDSSTSQLVTSSEMKPFYEESTSSVPTSINSLLEESTTLFVTATEITDSSTSQLVTSSEMNSLLEESTTLFVTATEITDSSTSQLVTSSEMRQPFSFTSSRTVIATDIPTISNIALFNISTTVSTSFAKISWAARGRQSDTEIYVAVMDHRDGIWRISEAVNTSKTFHVIEGLQPDTVYTVRLLATHWADNSSLFEEVFQTKGKGVYGNVSSRGWFVGMLCAVAFLTLAALIACFVTRNKGGKYAVKEKEAVRADLEAHCDHEETSCEYSDSDEKPLKRSQQSLEGDIKGDDSSMDSSGDYEDEDCEFNEDGSFIGEYAGHKRKLSTEVNGHTTITT